MSPLNSAAIALVCCLVAGCSNHLASTRQFRNQRSHGVGQGRLGGIHRPVCGRQDNPCMGRARNDFRRHASGPPGRCRQRWRIPARYRRPPAGLRLRPAQSFAALYGRSRRQDRHSADRQGSRSRHVDLSSRGAYPRPARRRIRPRPAGHRRHQRKPAILRYGRSSPGRPVPVRQRHDRSRRRSPSPAAIPSAPTREVARVTRRINGIVEVLDVSSDYV